MDNKPDKQDGRKKDLGRKIFVASSSADLIDVRAEIYTYLHELGLTPIMFERSFKKDPHDPGKVGDCCDLNVQIANAVVVILSERYGEGRTKCLTDKLGEKVDLRFDVSFTHAEYLEARRLGKSIHVYARRFLRDAHAKWDQELESKTKSEIRASLYDWSTKVKLMMKQDDKSVDPGYPTEFLELFRESISEPEKNDEHSIDPSQIKGLYCLMSNHRYGFADDVGWITAFDTVVDLKEHLRNDLNAHRLMANFEDLLRAGKLPFIRIAAARSRGQYRPGQDVYLHVANVAPTPAAFDSVCGIYITLAGQNGLLYLDPDTEEVILCQTEKKDDKESADEAPAKGKTSGQAENRAEDGQGAPASGERTREEGKGGQGKEDSIQPLKVEGSNWSPAEPSVLRDGDECVVRIECDSVPDGIDLHAGFTAWVVYQSVLGGCAYVADRYEIRLVGPEGSESKKSERGEPGKDKSGRSSLRIFYKGKHAVLPKKRKQGSTGQGA